jgi:hypothetical protein
MRRHQIASSSIRSAGYDARSRTLEIEFTDDAVHQYLNVPNAVYRALMSAPSKGQYVTAHIRDVYPHREGDGFGSPTYAGTAERSIRTDRGPERGH